MNEHLNFGLAKRLGFYEQRQLDVEVNGVLDDIQSDIECLQENLKALRSNIRAALYGEPRKPCAA
jgi:ATP phosphoribosyltransferase regulatory subunit HisZ